VGDSLVVSLTEYSAFTSGMPYGWSIACLQDCTDSSVVCIQDMQLSIIGCEAHSALVSYSRRTISINK